MMSALLTEARPAAAPSAAAPRKAGIRRGPALLAWAVLLLVLVLGLPLFLRMPLWSDALQYDICARMLLRGGALYRDAFDNNLPGIMWIQAGVRATLGWRPEALRLADFTFLALAVLLLLRWVPARGAGAPARIWTAAALGAFYLFAPDICHCQRDGWMLLPSVAALYLRDRQLRALAEAAPGRSVLGRAFLEGLCWGLAVWIKPFVMIPALACWLVSVRSVRSGWGRTCLDAGGLLAGGLLAGGLGLAWLAASGSWSSFWEILLVWDRDYAFASSGRGARLGRWLSWSLHYFPWSLLPLPSILLALIAIRRGIAGRSPAAPPAASRALLGAFSLGWMIQAMLLQYPHDYVLSSTIFPAVVLVAGALAGTGTPIWNGVFLGGVALLMTVAMPGLQLKHLLLWPRCWRQGGTAPLWDRLTLIPRYHAGACDWQDLARVADFLRAENVADGELTCFSGCTHPLYLDLHVEPATRFNQLGLAMGYHPAHAEQIWKELEASRTRFVVSDLTATGLTPRQAEEQVPGQPLALPPSFRPQYLDTFPWSEPLVFRSGRYVVHRVRPRR